MSSVSKYQASEPRGREAASFIQAVENVRAHLVAIRPTEPPLSRGLRECEVKVVLHVLAQSVSSHLSCSAITYGSAVDCSVCSQTTV